MKIITNPIDRENGKVVVHNKVSHCTLQHKKSCHVTDNKITQDENPYELKEQLGVVVEAIQILADIIVDDNNASNSLSCVDLRGYKRMEQLQSEWKLEETGFARLFNACKQMQNTLRLTSLEADEALKDAQRSNNIACAAKYQAEKLTKEVDELQRENSNLQQKNYVLLEKLQKESHQKKVMKRSIRNLLVDVSKGNGCELSSIIGMKENIPYVSNTPSPMRMKENIPSLSIVTPDSTSVEWEEVISPLSSSSLVTDDGCATVRFPLKQVRRKGKVKHTTKNNFRQSNVLELSFPSKETGLQLTPIPVKSPVSKGKMQKKGFFSNNSSNEEKEEVLLLVSGYMGFDETLHDRKPTFGSRLICIDGISVEQEKWTMEDYIDYICDKHEGRPMQMSFRNELLTTSQFEQLKRDGKTLKK